MDLENQDYNKLNEHRSNKPENYQAQSGHYEEIKSIKRSKFEAIKNRKLLIGSVVIICVLLIAIGVILGIFVNKSN